jgi:hypothetical protein
VFKNLDLDSPASRDPDSDLMNMIRKHGYKPNILSHNLNHDYFWVSTTLSITSSPSTIPTPSPTPAASAPKPSGLCAYILFFSLLIPVLWIQIGSDPHNFAGS